jgi:hypothetical protein
VRGEHIRQPAVDAGGRADQFLGLGEFQEVVDDALAATDIAVDALQRGVKKR